MYSRKEHAERLVSTFGFDCERCRAAILRDINASHIGAVYVGQRDDGLYRIGATTSAPGAHLAELSRVAKREHTLVHTISVLDSRALEGHLQRRLDPFLDERRVWYTLPPAVLAAVCATKHLCDVPSPYVKPSTTTPGFYKYIRDLEQSIGVVVA